MGVVLSGCGHGLWFYPTHYIVGSQYGWIFKLPILPSPQVNRLIGYCPLIESESCVLHDRGLSAVVALGLFAVETELKVNGRSEGGVAWSQAEFHQRL